MQYVLTTYMNVRKNLMIENIVNWINDYANINKLTTLVIGVSGGIDSALTSTLCAMTGLRVIVLNMPIHQDKTLDSRSDKHIDWLKERFTNVESQKIDLTKTFEIFSNCFGQ